jgi:hypothetical protein
MPKREFALPIPLTLLVCDGAHRDPATGKWTLLGLFNSIQSGEYPSVHPFMIAYLAITDAHGKVPLRFQLVDLDESEPPLFLVDGELEVENPRFVAEMVIPIPPVTFRHGGEHLLQVYAHGQFLLERRILALPE